MSAHFGNWEMLALSFSKRYTLSVIVAKQENPYFDKVINGIRSTKGYKTIYKEVAPIGVLRALKRKEFVAINDVGANVVIEDFLITAVIC